MKVLQSPAVSFVILCGILPQAWSQTATDAKNLREQIFVTNKYDKKIRPATYQLDPTEVYVSFFLLSINNLDEVTETLMTTGYLYIEWEDEFLTWNASDYNGIEYYHWPQDDVWKPDVALKNSFLEYKQLGVSTLNVVVNADGTVDWYPLQVFQSTCSIDISYFPFDTQTCQLKFVAWSYSKAEVDMQGGMTGIDMSQYETNAEWDVTSTKQTVKEESDEATIIYTIIMKRKPRYHILTLLLPIIMLTVLNLFVFVLPCECGEKASYGITVFLAFVVFLTIISTALPANSENSAIFSIYIIIQTLQSTVITLVALVLIRLNSFHYESRPVPGCLIAFLRLARFHYCPKRKSSIRLSKVAPDSPENEKNRIGAVMPEPAVDDDNEICTWPHVVNILDGICFVGFTVSAVISTIVCLNVLSNA